MLVPPRRLSRPENIPLDILKISQHPIPEHIDHVFQGTLAAVSSCPLSQRIDAVGAITGDEKLRLVVHAEIPIGIIGQLVVDQIHPLIDVFTRGREEFHADLKAFLQQRGDPFAG